MEEGTSQGCPLLPLFASFVIASLLKPIDGLLRERSANHLANGDSGDDGQEGISHLLSFVNDISSCIYLPDLHLLYVHKSPPTVSPLDASLTLIKPEYSPHAMEPPFYLPSLLTIHPWRAQSPIPSYHSQQHLNLLTKQLPTSLLHSPLVFDFLVNLSDQLPLPPISLTAALMTSKKYNFITPQYH